MLPHIILNLLGPAYLLTPSTLDIRQCTFSITIHPSIHATFSEHLNPHPPPTKITLQIDQRTQSLVILRARARQLLALELAAALKLEELERKATGDVGDEPGVLVEGADGHAVGPDAVADGLAKVRDHAVAHVSLRDVLLVEGLVRGGKVSHEQALGGLVAVGAEEGAVPVPNGDVDAFLDVVSHLGADEAVAELVDLDPLAERSSSSSRLRAGGRTRGRVRDHGDVTVGDAEVETEVSGLDVVVVIAKVDDSLLGLDKLAVEATIKVLRRLGENALGHLEGLPLHLELDDLVLAPGKRKHVSDKSWSRMREREREEGVLE